MSVFEDWSHRWFFPSMREDDGPNFVDFDWVCPQRPKVLHYLSHSPILVFGCGITWRTDGVWLWYDGDDGVAELMERERLRLPDAFMAHLASRNFEPLPCLDTTKQILHDTLDWPGAGPIPPIRKAVEAGLEVSNRPCHLCSSFKDFKPAPRPRAKSFSEWLLNRLGIY